MSRGLGKLQREIKTIVSDYTDWLYGEYVFPESNPGNAPWLTWAIIRNLYFQEHGLDSSITALISVHSSVERCLKRALNGLVDRGEVCRVPLGFGWHYTTPEQFQKCKELLAMAGIDRRMVPTAPDDVMALRALKATKTEPKPA